MAGQFTQGIGNIIDASATGTHTNQGNGNKLSSEPLPGPQEVFIVHGHAEGLIKTTDPVEKMPVGKCRLMGNHVSPAEFLPTPRMSADLT